MLLVSEQQPIDAVTLVAELLHEQFGQSCQSRDERLVDDAVERRGRTASRGRP